MEQDIRDKPQLCEADILALNFIRQPARFAFRKHHRTGLRSHIMEVLRPEALLREREGVLADGLRWFPKAHPLKMLRLFRTRFDHSRSALDEVRRIHLVLRHLTPRCVALSEEFLVDYRGPSGTGCLLCGLQEYVPGEILDPWGLLNDRVLASLLDRARAGLPAGRTPALADLRASIARFAASVKRLVQKTGHVPDLAGVGNLLLTPRGAIKLVDINNISEVVFDADIRLDDKGYPVCDKSIEALSLLERAAGGKDPDTADPLYGFFLDPGRKRDVQHLLRERYSERYATGGELPAAVGNRTEKTLPPDCRQSSRWPQ